MRTCEVPGCGRRHETGGRCSMHHMRQRLGIPDDQPVQRQATRQEVEDALPLMAQMRSEGGTYVDIAAAVGMCTDTVRRALKRAGVEAPKKPIPHGTPSGWQWHKCRCDVCLNARRLYKKTEREKRQTRPVTAEHGTERAYQQGCDCGECREAMRVYLADRQARSREHASRHGRVWQQWEAEVAFDTSLTIEERAARIGRTFAAVDNFIRAQKRRPDDPYRVKPR